MFSKTSLIIIFVVVFLAVNIIAVSLVDDRPLPIGPGKIVFSLISPFQSMVNRTLHVFQNAWRNYFFLISVSEENTRLKSRLRMLENKFDDAVELELANARLRELLNFQKNTNLNMIAASVIAKDPSPFSRTVMIDKGESSGLVSGLPVVMPEGIVGQVIETAPHYAKVLLIIDSNSAVDALVQRTRTRGLVKGSTFADCRLEYVLRKNEIDQEDVLITSGLDGVFPKGLRIGSVKEIFSQTSGIFQDVTIDPFVNFEKLEEVLIILNPPQYDFTADP